MRINQWAIILRPNEPITSHLEKRLKTPLQKPKFLETFTFPAFCKDGAEGFARNMFSAFPWFNQPISMESSQILVTGFPDDTTKTELVIYFQSERDSGGGDVESIEIDQGRAVVSFETPEGMKQKFWSFLRSIGEFGIIAHWIEVSTRTPLRTEVTTRSVNENEKSLQTSKLNCAASRFASFLTQ